MKHLKELRSPILIADLSKSYGGAEVRVFDTAQALHGRYPYAVATLAGSPLHRRLETAGLTTLAVPYSRSDPRLVLFFWSALRNGGYRVLDAHNVHSQFWAHLAAVLAGTPLRVSTVHSAYRLEYNGSPRGRLYEQVLRLNARCSVRFIAVSEAVHCYLQGIGIPGERISLIHNSIHLPDQATGWEDAPLLASLGWPPDAYTVVVVARLEPVKGHTFLIDALSRVIPDRPRLRCLIVGNGRSREALETQVKQLHLQDYVHFAGFREDIPALLRSSQAFCLPSLSEGLPYALLEACAHRLPALVTEVGGMARLLRHGETAYLVPPSDPAALAEGLRWLIDYPKEATTLGQAAYDMLRQRFSPEEMMAGVLKVYGR